MVALALLLALLIIVLLPISLGAFTPPASAQTNSFETNSFETNSFETNSFASAPASASPSTGPTVKSTTPLAGATGVSRGANVTATFSEAMYKATINKSTFKLFKVTSSGTPQITNVAVRLSSDGLKATLDPFGPSTMLLAKGTKYKAVVTTGAKDLAGNALDQNPSLSGNQPKSWNFTVKN